MARPKRFELLTPRSVVWCSIQLSYGRIRRRESAKKAGPRQGAHPTERLCPWQGCGLSSLPLEARGGAV